MKKAFTMIEIIFIIVIVGILSSIAVSRFNSKDLLKGAEMVARDIEYTKHLAVIDDHNALSGTSTGYDNEHEYFGYWAFKILNPSDPKISIFKHLNATDYYGTVENSAVDYMDKNMLLAVGSDDKSIDNKTSSRVFLKKTYGIKRFDLKECQTPAGQVNTILFNEEGVPYGINISGSSASNFGKFTQECVIKLEAGSSTACIKIHHETGFVKLGKVQNGTCDYTPSSI